MSQMNPQEAVILVGNFVYAAKTDRVKVLHLPAEVFDIGVINAKDEHGLQRVGKTS